MPDLTLKMILLGQDVSQSKAVKGVGDELDRTHDRAQKLGQGVKVGLAAVGAGVGYLLKTGFGEVKDASAANAQLEAGIKSTRNAAHVGVDELNNLASAIQGYSGQTDDSIAASESLLLTFTNIKNVGVDRVFDDATRTSADMAAKMGGDASKYAVLLGKALNDPVKGITALTRVGVSFTQAQKDQIAAMVKTGDVVGAQKIILKELNTEFGGAAKAAGESVPGQLARARRSFEDTSQSLVGTLMPAFSGFMGFVTGRAMPGLNQFFGGLTGNVKRMKQEDRPAVELFGLGLRSMFQAMSSGDVTSTGFIGNMESAGVTARQLGLALINMGRAVLPVLIEAWEAFREPLSELFHFVLSIAIPTIIGLSHWMQDHATIVRTVAVAVGVVVAALKLWAIYTRAVALVQRVLIASQVALNAVMAMNPIALVVLAIIALAAAFIYAYKHSETFRRIVDGAFRAAQAAGSAMWNFLKPIFKALVDTFLQVAGAIVHGAATAFGWVPGIGGKLKGAAKAFDSFRDDVNRALSQTQNNYTLQAHVQGEQNVINSLRTIAGLQDYIRNSGQVDIGVSGRGVAGRATGGPVRRGVPYIVGEHRPELFIPNEDGRIIPQLPGVAYTNRAAEPEQFHLHLHLDRPLGTPQAIAREVVPALQAAKASGMRLNLADAR